MFVESACVLLFSCFSSHFPRSVLYCSLSVTLFSASISLRKRGRNRSILLCSSLPLTVIEGGRGPRVPDAAGHVPFRAPAEVDGDLLRLQRSPASVRRLHGLGDPQRQDPGSQRLAVHRLQRLQRGADERVRGGAVQHPVVPAHAVLRHRERLHGRVHHRHSLPALRAQGEMDGARAHGVGPVPNKPYDFGGRKATFEE